MGGGGLGSITKVGSLDREGLLLLQDGLLMGNAESSSPSLTALQLVLGKRGGEHGLPSLETN